jgi:hypothetical protein
LMTTNVDQHFNHDDYTFVERILPARVLLEIGIYLQTAAHLELEIWRIIIAAEGKTEGRILPVSEYLEVKNVTRKLVDRLSRSAALCSPSVAVRIAVLAGRISDGLENRNLAAHGAFFSDFGRISVKHFIPRGKKTQRSWFEDNRNFSQRDFRTAIEDIDGLLREALDIKKCLIDQK